jgi:hypothetical protein
MPNEYIMANAKESVSSAEPAAAILVLNPMMSIIGKTISNTVAAIASVGINEASANEFTFPTYATKFPQFPHATSGSPAFPHNPKRSATGDRKLAAVAKRYDKMARS